MNLYYAQKHSNQASNSNNFYNKANGFPIEFTSI